MLTFGVALIKHSKVDSLIQYHEIKLSTKKQSELDKIEDIAQKLQEKIAYFDRISLTQEAGIPMHLS